MAKRVSSPDLIGREAEVGALVAALERAAEGEFGAAMVGGEAGVGKSRVVGELGLRAVASGARVLVGECVELAEGELPFAPLTAALRPVATELGPAELATLPGREELSRLLPDLGDAGAEWTSRDSALGQPLAQSRLFEVLLALFARLGAEAPVVLVLEDLHWADRSTRDFLSFLVRNARDTRLLVVCTFRTDELDRRHPLRPFLAELDRRPAVERIDLVPLDREQLAGLIAGVLGHEPGEPLLAELYERTDGNPFFAEELLAASADGGEIPATLRDAMMLRVEPLSEPARHVLRVAGAAGRTVGHSLLARVAGLGESELDDALRETVDASILVQSGSGFGFRHALVREAVVADILPGERTKLHAQLAEALAADPELGEGSGGDAAAELAHHWWEARRLPEALETSVAAGRAAEDVFAFAEALRHLEHALEIWDQVEDAAERARDDHAAILAAAAENASMILEPSRAIALAREAIAMVDAEAEPVRSALLHERLGRDLWVFGDSEGSLASYHEAVDLMPPTPPSAELARVLAAHGQILMLRGRPRESRERCEQAIEVARSVGARAEEGHALNTLGVDISSLGDWARGIEHLREAKRIAEDLGSIDEIGRAWVNLSEEVDWSGNTAEAAEMAREGSQAMRRLGTRTYAIFLETEASQRFIRLGRLAEAERSLAWVEQEGGATGISEAIFANSTAEVARLRGDLEAAVVAGKRALQAIGRYRDSMYFGPTAAIDVEVKLATGDAAEAAAAFERAVATIEGEYASSVARLYARGVQAYAELAERAAAGDDDRELGRLREAAAVAVARFDAVLAPERFPEGSTPPIPIAYRAVVEAELSRLGGGSDAKLWRRAVAAWEELEAPLERCYAEIRGAEALLAAGNERKEAERLLSKAAASAREIGATAVLDEIEALAKRVRVSIAVPEEESGPQTAPDADPYRLTDRELEVLELVVEGCTNREIGERLFISQKTASVHVSRILAKLDVRGRVEAATKAQRLGILG